MTVARIRELIAARTGLQADSLGSGALKVAVEGRVRHLGAADAEAYAARLAAEPQEFQALVDTIVIPETWFFRGGAKLYDAIADRARAAADAGKPFRILSVPCSTGEEPYSVAMALTDAGLPPSAWSLDAADISGAAIAAAQLGLFREFSFRDTAPGMRATHFAAVGGRYEIAGHLRRLVRFRVGNLLDAASWMTETGRYDCILCRNLLIYLTPEARRAALATLDRLLAPDGVLGLGHAEAGNLHDSGFESVGPEGGFLFRRKPPAEPKSELLPRPAAAPAIAVKPMSPGVRPAAPSLTKAQAFADGGRLAEATAVCRAVLAVAPSAGAYCLLGIVLGACGQSEAAAEAFRKALYLDPQHREALTHGLLMAEAKGDAGLARMYRARLARLPNPGAPP